MQRFIAHLLIVLACWTLLIKFAFPLAMAAADGLAPLTYVYWDFWWVVHLWLAWALIREPGYTYWLAMITSVVEVIIIVTKFGIFLSAPTWTIWQTNWFINKVFVLAAFILLFAYLLGPGRRLRGAAGKRLSATAADSASSEPDTT